MTCSLRPRPRLVPSHSSPLSPNSLSLKLWGLLSMWLLLGASSSFATVISIAGGDSGSLQTAINNASEGDILELGSGTFNVPAGGFLITNPGASFTIRSASGATVALDGNQAQPVLRYLVDNPGLRGHVIFEDLIFREGASSISGTVGGVSMSGAYATFRRCTFEDNEVTGGNGAGGALGLFSASRATITDSVFQNNVARNSGAAMRIGTDSIAWVHRSQFLNNRSNMPGHRPSSSGGAIDVSDSVLRISNSRFVGNEAGFVGGAIWALGTFTEPNSVPRTDVVISNCTFEDNHARPDAAITTPSPTEGGALHAENQTLMRVYNSRFFDNSSQLGGAVSLYRARAEVESSVFMGNFTFFPGNVGGFGGTFKITSADISDATTNNGTINRPSSEFSLRDSLVEGLGGAADTALKGGCLFAQGDTNRTFGLGGVSQMGSGTVNRTVVEIFDTVFNDCDIDFKSDSAGSGVGGGLNLNHVNLDLRDSIFTNCDATGTDGVGGAIRALADSEISIVGTTFANNTAERFGGALQILGSDLDVNLCTFSENDVSPGFVEPISQSFGAALYSAPHVNLFGSFDFEVTGTVRNSLFSSNIGLDIWDKDQAAGPINDLRFNSNTFFNDSYSDSVYRDNIQGPAVNAAGLNTLVISRDGGVPSTDKSQTNNSQLSVPAIIGAILAVPPQIHGSAASGDLGGGTESYLGFAWSGGSATVDGGAVSGNTGLQTAGVGTHTLAVDGQNFQDTITSGTTPNVNLTATPVEISSGDSSTLAWSSSGTFIDLGMDQSLNVSGASGNTVVSPTESTTYTVCVIAEQGGDVESERVFVDEPAGDVLFEDGFESGDTQSWSTTVP